MSWSGWLLGHKAVSCRNWGIGLVERPVGGWGLLVVHRHHQAAGQVDVLGVQWPDRRTRGCVHTREGGPRWKGWYSSVTFEKGRLQESLGYPDKYIWVLQRFYQGCDWGGRHVL